MPTAVFKRHSGPPNISKFELATDPHRPTQTSSLADPAKEEGVIASR